MSVVNILDNDLYKFIMHQFIFEKYPDVQTEWEVLNRSHDIKLRDDIPYDELLSELLRIKEFRFTNRLIEILQSAWPHFTPEYLNYLRTFKLSNFSILPEHDNYKITLKGSWLETTLWESMILSTITELRTNRGSAPLDQVQNDFILKETIICDYNALYGVQVDISEFGTRRRFSQEFQEWMIQSPIWTSTSNVWLSHLYDIPCVGTYAHEIPMVLTALADKHRMFNAQYEYPEYCVEKYGSTLVLPDTYGSTQFFENIHCSKLQPFNIHTVRVDSKDPVVAGDEILTFFRDMISDPSQRSILFSEDLNVSKILYLHNRFAKYITPKFGWGTDAANGTPNSPSIVCKVTKANDQPCIKLSDSFTKTTSNSYVGNYLRIFGHKGMV